MDFKKTNMAVIKSMFLQMDKETFKKNMELLKEELLGLEVSPKNSNYRNALINLYRWLLTLNSNKI